MPGLNRMQTRPKRFAGMYLFVSTLIRRAGVFVSSRVASPRHAAADLLVALPTVHCSRESHRSN